jgi:acyl-CoA thioesterase FadM
MVGTLLPGECALLQRMNLSFLRPVHPGARLRVKAVVEQISVSVQTAILKVVIEDSLDGQAHARGTVQVGFTAPEE